MDLRVLGLALVATALLAGCGESQDTVVLDNGNDNTIRTTATPFAGTTPTAVPTPQRTATDVPGTATPAPDGTETPGPGATETEAGPSGTPGPGADSRPHGQPDARSDDDGHGAVLRQRREGGR